MLSGSFFEIQSFTIDNPDETHLRLRAVASLNDNHPIFQGHFPGNPVVPGVCQVQMVKELVELAVNRALLLKESDNIKFLSMINPTTNKVIEFDILIRLLSDQQLSATASIGSGTTIFFKFKGKFVPGS
ncbi:MAG: hypothetical protein NT040_18915 [Bacteroidetes bacterium]|nr:hypothetical protein [Bacteroidota bacterium]